MPRSFANIIDYVRTQLDTFDQRDVCRVDSLVFSWLAYFQLPAPEMAVYGLDGAPLKDWYRADWFAPMCDKIPDSKSSVELLAAVAASPRFRNVRVTDYVSYTNELVEQQFSAMTFHLGPRKTFVAFRGTDNTLVGWKEDFNMAFRTAIPSQVTAVQYLEHAAHGTEGRLWCGGHSKGGNLAVYAGVMCEDATYRRLVACFSHDGPGFSSKTMDDPRWGRADGLVDKTIPQSSLVGMVFENQEHDAKVVHSHSIGFSQHDPFTWEVDGCEFVFEERLGERASTVNASVNDWLAHASDKEREEFVDAVFGVLGASGESTMADIRANWRVTVPRMLAAAALLDPSKRKVVTDALGDVIRPMVPSRLSLDKSTLLSKTKGKSKGGTV
ncbi:MAG: DUF2974 domain-containing protein [Coriobacteriales bacterium]|nr:DUF2974 domain-containing protein [Coriobacteriales bacterium]